MSRGRAILLGAAFAPALALALGAQASSHRVSGTVYDPNAGVRLASAVVQALRVDSSGAALAGGVFTAVTDSAGRYQIDGLPDGRYAIGFQHAALTVLGIDSPIDAFELGKDTALRLNLTVPSGRPLREMLCGPMREGARDGVITGLMLAARGDTSIAGATITARWTEVGVVRGMIGPAAHEAAATAGADGVFRLCDLPSDSPVDVDIRGTGARRIVGEVWIPPGSVVRRDFHLVDSSTTRGSAVFAGRVLSEDSTTVTTGRVTLPALGLEARVRDGRFSMAQVPAGTWAIEVRSLGFEPLNALVEVVDHQGYPARITMAREAQKLEAVNVVGKANRDVKVLAGIAERMRAGAGTALLPGNSWLVGAFDPSDAFRGARGFLQKGQFSFEARPYVRNGALVPCGTTTLPPSGGGKAIAIFVDGARYPAGVEQLNNDLRMDQVLAMELYPDVISAPFIYRSSATCAVIAVWTRR